MKHALSLALAAALLTGIPADAAAQADAQDGAIRVWFTGASNIRHFTCRATEVGGGEQLPSPSIPHAPPDSAGPRVTLRIPVTGLNCGIGMMSRHLHHALHAELHPAIQFTLADYELVPGDSGWSVRMNGALDIAGVRRPVSIDAAVTADSAGVAHVRGTHDIRVTDYGVAPPRRFLGLLRVRDQVTVHFDVPLPDPARPAAHASLPE
jgi:polyisoprenoid-binding protein YceI